MFSFIKSIFDKLNIKFNINKMGHKATVKNSAKSQILQAGRNIHYASKEKSEELHDIRLEVKFLKKCLNETGAYGQIFVISGFPDGYHLKLDFINRGSDNTIKNLLLFINDKEYKPDNFKPLELNKAKMITKDFYFSEDKNNIIDSGRFFIKVKDIYDNEFETSGSFPIDAE